MNTLRKNTQAGIFALVFTAGMIWLSSGIGEHITLYDSGELAVGGVKLGVAHPPGYPAWCIQSGLFGNLPWSTPAFRLGISSAFWASMSAGAGALIALELAGPPAALISGMALLIPSHFLQQATVAEVYALNLFFVMSLLYLMVLWKKRRSIFLLNVAAMLFGLSAANHNTTLLLIPVMAGWLLVYPVRGKKRAATWFAAAGASFLLGLMMYVYLPVRSSAGPVLDWGRCETFKTFLAHVIRFQYGNFQLY